MSPEAILELWCPPYSILSEKDADLFKEKTLFFEGARGCGKTMLLKWLSSEVQSIRAGEENTPFLTHIADQEGVGLYVRIDNATLNAFTGPGYPEKFWEDLFSHYFEIAVARRVLELLDLIAEDPLGRPNSEGIDRALQLIADELGVSEITEIEGLKKHVEDELRRVDRFRSGIAFQELEFFPHKAFKIGDLSAALPSIVCQNLPPLNESRLLISIDEYENFSRQQQRLINSLVRSSGEHVGFRLAMRKKGLKTKGTVSEQETIKERHDYRKVEFAQPLSKTSEYRAFLEDVCRSRLEAVERFSEEGMTDIRSILGKEDDEQEARDLVERSSRPQQHFDYLEHAGIEGDEKEDVTETIRCEENPLLEMLNILYVIRGEDPEDVKERMEEYLEWEETEDRHEKPKYAFDYKQKYKLSLLFLLNYAYKSDKKYYGFNIYCFISSGIPRNFINLCKTAFYKAHFELGMEELIDRGSIPRDIQHEAAMKESESELSQVVEIPEHGEDIDRLVRNLGAIFLEHHKDPRVRYAEVNTFNLILQEEENREVRDTCVMWSIIQEKPDFQPQGPDSQLEQLYTINRLLCPVFQLSYRTRGGIIPDFSDREFRMLREELNPDYHDLGLRIAKGLPESQADLDDFIG